MNGRDRGRARIGIFAGDHFENRDVVLMLLVQEPLFCFRARSQVAGAKRKKVEADPQLRSG